MHPAAARRQPKLPGLNVSATPSHEPFMPDARLPPDPPARPEQDTLEDEWFAKPTLPPSVRPPPGSRVVRGQPGTEADVDPLDRWFE